MEKRDPRINAFRPDLADEQLRGKVEAEKFVHARLAQIEIPVAAMLKSPSTSAQQVSQALWGETCKVFEVSGGFAWVQMLRDNYVGYIQESAICFDCVERTHQVNVPSTFAYPKPDIKSFPPQTLPLNSSVRVQRTTGEFSELACLLYVFTKHLNEIPPHPSHEGGRWHEVTDGGLSASAESKFFEAQTAASPPSALSGTFSLRGKSVIPIDFVTVAESFLNTPYLWGGKTSAGLDCSGLVQITLQAAGTEAPRDSDMQERDLGETVVDHSALQRGDLVFWPGHVGIMQSPSQVLHANSHHMQVTSETLAEVTARSPKPITSIKRLSHN